MFVVNKNIFIFVVLSNFNLNGVFTTNKAKTKIRRRHRGASPSVFSLPRNEFDSGDRLPFVKFYFLFMLSKKDDSQHSPQGRDELTLSSRDEHRLNLMLEAFQELGRISDDPFNLIEDRIYDCFKCKSKDKNQKAIDSLVFVFVVNLVRVKGGKL